MTGGEELGGYCTGEDTMGGIVRDGGDEGGTGRVFGACRIRRGVSLASVSSLIEYSSTTGGVCIYLAIDLDHSEKLPQQSMPYVELQFLPYSSSRCSPRLSNGLLQAHPNGHWRAIRQDSDASLQLMQDRMRGAVRATTLGPLMHCMAEVLVFLRPLAHLNVSVEDGGG